METAKQAIRDFLKAVDGGFLGRMPDGFNNSSFVIDLRVQANAETFACESCCGVGWMNTPGDPADPRDCPVCRGTGMRPVSVEDQRKYGVIR